MIKPHIITIMFKAAPGKEKALKDFLDSITDVVAQSPGCMKHDLHQCVDDPSTFMLYENWTNKAAHADHVARPEVQAWIAEAPSFLEKPCEIKCWSMW